METQITKLEQENQRSKVQIKSLELAIQHLEEDKQRSKEDEKQQSQISQDNDGKMKEMLEENNSKGYDPEASDVFSLGIVLFVIYMGRPPFRISCADKDEFYQMLVSDSPQDFWTVWESKWVQRVNVTIGDDFKQLFTVMTSQNPEDRPRLSDLQKHPWLAQVESWKPVHKVAVISEMSQIN